ncbi:hypothetical protein B0F90DRAFT_1666180 [Multifurca ochricompacta]|uniref:Uncharacterized protein n=1 Tax=Multifurca ochricompacta TaxID=376703 RepID=A0AAD4MBE5_9AGAM|nr:hypothetical protein B0F90DRAFT_1666180 [Multifurca ochricompacta]
MFWPLLGSSKSERGKAAGKPIPLNWNKRWGYSLLRRPRLPKGEHHLSACSDERAVAPYEFVELVVLSLPTTVAGTPLRRYGSISASQPQDQSCTAESTTKSLARRLRCSDQLICLRLCCGAFEGEGGGGASNFLKRNGQRSPARRVQKPRRGGGGGKGREGRKQISETERTTGRWEGLEYVVALGDVNYHVVPEGPGGLVSRAQEHRREEPSHREERLGAQLSENNIKSVNVDLHATRR